MSVIDMEVMIVSRLASIGWSSVSCRYSSSTKTAKVHQRPRPSIKQSSVEAEQRFVRLGNCRLPDNGTGPAINILIGCLDGNYMSVCCTAFAMRL